MPTLVLNKARGLYNFSNQIAAPEGALLDAKNVVINRDNVIESRRGFALYSNAFGSAATRASQLQSYKDRILLFYNSTLAVDNGSGTFSSLAGSYSPTEAGLRIRGLEANGNFYFTTSAGIKKISVTQASELSTTSVTNSGGVKAIDGVATLNSAEGWFTQDSKVAYRVIWGIKDANQNLILGTPSERIELSNPLLSLLITSFNNLLTQLDTENLPGGINDANYVSSLQLQTTDTISTVKTNINSLRTKLDSDITITGFSSVSTYSKGARECLLTFNASVANHLQANDYISVSGCPTAEVNGTHQIISVSSKDVKFKLLDNTGTATSSGSSIVVKRAKYDISPYREIPTAVDVPVSTTNVTIDSTIGKAFISFSGAIDSYISIDDTITITGLTGTGITSVNGTHTVIGINKNSSSVANTIVISFIGATVSTNDTGGMATLNQSTLDLTLSPTPTTAQQQAIQSWFDSIVLGFQSELPGIATAADYSTLTAITTASANVTFTIPEAITTAHFYQLYRSPLATSSGTLTIDDVSPSDEMNLVFEANPSTAELAAEEITIHDIQPDDLREGGTYLYTNPNNGEGIGQANEPPPLAKDICLYKNHTFYANTQTRHRLYLNVIGVTGINSTSSYIKIGNSTTSQTYRFALVENAATNHVLLPTSSDLSVSQKIDQMSRSLVRVINKTANSLVYAYYISGTDTVPGQILLETRDLSGTQFYITSDSTGSGEMFSPDISPKIITANSVANPTVVTSAGHNMAENQKVYIFGSNSTPSIDGYRTISSSQTNTFTVPVNVTVGGTSGTVATVISDNEVKRNRIYYSKYQQPEAVPVLNWIAVGPEDKEIRRILALRDSLFILKDEGVYRLSGTSAPFQVDAFDFSTQIIAPDSAVVLNNQIYTDSNQGIASISETGVTIISRPIENLLIKLTSYANYSTATFGVSYESDRAYLFWTVTETADTVATHAYRYNTFTQTWTEWDLDATCGIVNSFDDKLYFGAGDTNYVSKERKNFLRTDYADRQIIKTLSAGTIEGSVLKLNTVTDVNVGDVIVQEQTITIEQINRLLAKLDLDTGVADNNYNSLLLASVGVDMRVKLNQLAAKLDADTGVADSNYVATIAGYGSSFADTLLAFNAITAKLNLDSGVSYTNYPTVTGTVSFEIDIIAKNTSTAKITVRDQIPFVVGDTTIYAHYDKKITWVPQTMGDVSAFKQVRETTFMFENSAFTNATASYSSDLSPDFFDIPFDGSGNGIFGSSTFGNSYTFGGSGTYAPFRTLIPRIKQRCRFIKPKFTHAIARENFSVYGLSLTFEAFSTKAYR